MSAEDSPNARIEVKLAVEISFRLFGELYDTRKFTDIMLEEAELSKDKTAWRITISFCRQMPSINIMESIGSRRYIRSLKRFQIDARDGHIISMKNCRADDHQEV